VDKLINDDFLVKNEREIENIVNKEEYKRNDEDSSILTNLYNMRDFYNSIDNGTRSFSVVQYEDIEKQVNEIINDNIDSNILINGNYYKLVKKSNTEEVFVEDKHSKDLYNIYDARIFDKKINSNKLYFNTEIDYVNVKNNFENLKNSNIYQKIQI